MKPIQYDSIYLAPHLDDVALSCGGRIFMEAAMGKTVLIVTIMAGIPKSNHFSGLAQDLLKEWAMTASTMVEGIQERRVEDVTAAKILGADYQQWEWLDCIYRTDIDGRPFYDSWDAVFGTIASAEIVHIQTLAHELSQLPPHNKLFAPLAIGHHVDHQLTRAAAERCFGANLLYYEDYPYVQEPGALAEMIPPHDRQWVSERLPLTDAALQTKIEAIAAFASQLHMLFPGEQDGRANMAHQVQQYTRMIGGERIWRRS